MKLNIKDARKVKILELSGRLIIGEPADTLREAVQSLGEEGFVNLIFNMQNVTRLDSAGMGEMCSALHHVQKRGGRIHLLLPHHDVLRTIGQVGLRLRFPIFKSELDAVAAFLEPPREETAPTQPSAEEIPADSRAEAGSPGK